VTKEEATAVKKGDKIHHKHYGMCIVQKTNFFETGSGIIIKPLTDDGKLLLHFHSGTPIGTPILDHSLSNFRPIDRPFKQENKTLVQLRKKLKRIASRVK
jgi:hypothetical protein